MSRFRKPLLLVDGYNIIGAWPQLQRERDRDFETARHCLLEILLDYSGARALLTQVVFDAQFRAGPARTEEHGPLLTSHYTTAGQTADTYIEKLCADYDRTPKHARASLLVATSDRAQQLTVSGYGAQWRSAEQLALDIRSTKQQTRRRQQPARTRGRSLFHSLDASAQQQLAQLRKGKL